MPESIEGLTYAGFNVLSLANNHIMEHGKEALLDTMNILRTCGIEYAGLKILFFSKEVPELDFWFPRFQFLNRKKKIYDLSHRRHLR